MAENEIKKQFQKSVNDSLSGFAKCEKHEYAAEPCPDQTGYQILKTLCAFANDSQNLNGGYIVVGVTEGNACAFFPPKGLVAEQEGTTCGKTPFRSVAGIAHALEKDLPLFL